MTAGVPTFTLRMTKGGLTLVMHDQGIFWILKLPRRKISPGHGRFHSKQSMEMAMKGRDKGHGDPLSLCTCILILRQNPMMSRAPRYTDKGSSSSLPPSGKSMKSWLRTRLCFRKLDDPSPGPKKAFGNVTKESPPLDIRNVLGTPQAGNRCRFSV